MSSLLGEPRPQGQVERRHQAGQVHHVVVVRLDQAGFGFGIQIDLLLAPTDIDLPPHIRRTEDVEPEELVGDVELSLRVGPALLILLDQHLVRWVELVEPPQPAGVEPLPHGVGDGRRGVRRSHLPPEGESGLEPVDGIPHEDEELGLRRGLGQEGCHPRMGEVVRCPLPGDGAGSAGEPLMVLTDVDRTERLDAEPREEMPLLVDVGTLEDVRMLADQLVPPAGARLLDADADEVWRGHDLVGSGRRRSEVESGFPRRVAAPGMEQPDGVRREAAERLADELGRAHRIRLPHPSGREERCAGGMGTSGSSIDCLVEAVR